jgi:DNA-binding transcriptional LysR family regulator
MNEARGLRSVDLNLLPILRELLRARNVSRAAEALGMSQSSVSEALNRLRFQFKDEILVRVGRVMTPTQFALSLAGPVERMLARLESIVASPDFDPKAVVRQFVVATADNVIVGLGPRLMATLATDAPNVTVQFVDIQWMEAGALENGTLDLAIVPELNPGASSLNSQLLFQEEYVCVARRGSPASQRSTDSEEIVALPTMTFRADLRSPRSPSVFGKLDQLRMPHFLPQPLLAAQTEAVALLPRRLAQRFVTLLDLELFEPPRRLPPVNVRAYWAAVHENDPTHSWFRAVIGATASECFA